MTLIPLFGNKNVPVSTPGPDVRPVAPDDFFYAKINAIQAAHRAEQADRASAAQSDLENFGPPIPSSGSGSDRNQSAPQSVAQSSGISDLVPGLLVVVVFIPALVLLAVALVSIPGMFP